MKKFFTLVAAALFATSAMAALEQDANGVYQIANGDDLYDFYELVNKGATSSNAVLTADIDLEGFTFKPIGSESYIYCGTFDGQGHKIVNMEMEYGSDYVGLFGVLGGGAVIQNVIVDSSCSIRGGAFVGGIAGGTKGKGTVTFLNCGNAASVTAAAQNAAGILGVDMLSEADIVMKNCWNMGTISGERECAGLTGWAGDRCVIDNCWNIGEVNGVDGNRWAIRYNGGTVTNLADVHENTWAGNGLVATTISAEAAASDPATGELCFALNGNQSENVTWFQNLDNGTPDAFPTADDTHGVVYAVGELHCDGTAKSADVKYSNTNGAVRDDHNYVAGFCDFCNIADVNYLPMEGDYYLVGSYEDLVWYRTRVNNLNEGGLKIKLTADIDLSAESDWTPIGVDTDNGKMWGEIDGQGHRIMNMTIDTDAKERGFIFVASGGAVIKNLIIDESCEIYGGPCTAALMGCSNGTIHGNTITIENVVNEANVEAAGKNAAAFMGCNYYGDGLKTNFKNCVNHGSITGTEESAIFSAWMNWGGSLEGCWNTGELMGADGANTLVRGLDEKFVNATYDVCDMNIPTEKTSLLDADADCISNGHLCYALNGDQSNISWYQEIGVDEMPTLAGSARVYALGSLDCMGKMGDDITYTNEAAAAPQRADHEFDNNICVNCGSRHITTVDELLDAADYVQFENGNIEIFLDNDLDLAGKEFAGLGTEPEGTSFCGLFDGQGHVISNWEYNAGGENVGFIGFTRGDAVVRNLTIDASCSVEADRYAAGIIGGSRANTLLIENCGNEANVTIVEQNGAGILGCNFSGVVTINNCYNAGDISGERECAAISGWLGDNAVVKNTYNCGWVDPACASFYDEATGKADFFWRRGGGTTADNCYDLNADYNITNITEEELTDGSLVAKLNNGAEGPFVQGEDHPVLSSSFITGVNNAAATVAAEGIYSISGVRQNTMVKGLNIVKANGKVSKVLVK